MSSFVNWLRHNTPFMKNNSRHAEYELDEIPLDQVVGNPYQPRSHIDEDALDELATSIKEYGVITPIQVTETENDNYQLIAGERRVRASRQLGLETIPALIRDYDEEEIIEVSFLENLQREPMNPVDKASMYERLRSEFKNLTLEELGELIGKSPDEIREHEWILNLSSVVKQALARQIIDRELARSLKELSTNKQHTFISYLIKEDPDSEQIEDKLQELKQTPQEEMPDESVDEDATMEETFDDDLNIPGELQEREP